MGKKGKRKSERDKEKPAVYIEPESRGLSLYDVKRKLQTTQRLIQKKDFKKMFSSPITDTAAPGYSQIIAKPMDFYTINKKISSESYSVFRDYMTDVGLVLQNCMTYNMGDTPYYKYAGKLAPVFEKIFEKELGIKFTISLPPPRSEPILLRDIIPGYESSEDDERMDGEQESDNDEEEEEENILEETVSETQSCQVFSEEPPKEHDQSPNCENFAGTMNNETVDYQSQQLSNQDEHNQVLASTSTEDSAVAELHHGTKKLILEQNSTCSDAEEKKCCIAVPQNQPSPAPRLLDVSLPLEVDTEQNSDKISVASDVSKTSGFSLASSSLQTPSTPTKQRKPYRRKKKNDMYEFVDEDIPDKPFNDIPGKSKLSIEDILNMSSETCGDNEDASLNPETSVLTDKPCSPIQFSDSEENTISTAVVPGSQDVQLEETEPIVLEEKSESISQPEINSTKNYSEDAVEDKLASTEPISAPIVNSSSDDVSLEQHVYLDSAAVNRETAQLECISNLPPVVVENSSLKTLDVQTEYTQGEVSEIVNSVPPPNAVNHVPNSSNPLSSRSPKVPDGRKEEELSEPPTSSEPSSQTSPGFIKKRRGRPKLDRSKITGSQSPTPPMSPAVATKIDVSAVEATEGNLEPKEMTLPPVASVPNSNSDLIAQEAHKLERLPSIAENPIQELQIDESQIDIVEPKCPEAFQMGVTPSSPQFIPFSESLENPFCDPETPLIIDQSSCDRSAVATKNPFNDNVFELPLAQIDSSETLAAVAAISADEAEEIPANMGVGSSDFKNHMESCSKPLEVMTHLIPQLAPPVSSQSNSCYATAQGQQNIMDSFENVQPFNEELNTCAPGSVIVSSSLSDLAALLVSPQTTVSSSKNTSLNSLECSFGFGLSPGTLSLTPSTNVSLNFETSPTKMFDDLICCIDTPQKFTPPVTSNLAVIPAAEAPVVVDEQQPRQLIQLQVISEKPSLKRTANPADCEEPASKVAKEAHPPSEEQAIELEGYVTSYTDTTPILEQEVSYSLPFDKFVETPLAGSYELPLGHLKNGGIQKEVRFLPVTPCLENNIVLSKDCFITKCDVDEDICKLKTYSYLSYGSHGHYAPDKELCEEPYTLPSEKDILHSVYSGPVGLQFAESLQKFTAQMNPYMKRVVDDFLNSLTDEKHSLYQNNQLLSLPMEDSDNLSISQKEIKQLRTLKKLGIDISFLDEAKESTDRPKINHENQNQGKQSLPKVQAVSSLNCENSQQGSISDPEPSSVSTTITQSESSFEPNFDSLSNIVPTMSVSSNSNLSSHVIPSLTDSNVVNAVTCNYQQPPATNMPNLQFTNSFSGSEDQTQHFYDNTNLVPQYGLHAAPCVSVADEAIFKTSNTSYTTSNQLNVPTCQTNMGYIATPTQNVPLHTSKYPTSQAPKLQLQSQVKPTTTVAPLIKLPPISQFNESLSRLKGDRFDFGRSLKSKSESQNMVQNLAVDHERLERPKSATCVAPTSDLRNNELYIHNPRSAPNIGDRNSFASFPGCLQTDALRENLPDERNSKCYGGNVQRSLMEKVSSMSSNNSSTIFIQNVANCSPAHSNEHAGSENCSLPVQMPTSCTASANNNAGFYTKTADVGSIYNSVYENSVSASNELPAIQVSTNHQIPHSQQHVCNGYSNEYSSYGHPSRQENTPANFAAEGAGHPTVQPRSVFFEEPLTFVPCTRSAVTTVPSNTMFDGLSIAVSNHSSDGVSPSKQSLMHATWDTNSQAASLSDTSFSSLDLQSQESLLTPTTSASDQSFLAAVDANAVGSS